MCKQPERDVGVLDDKPMEKSEINLWDALLILSTLELVINQISLTFLDVFSWLPRFLFDLVSTWCVAFNLMPLVSFINTAE